MDVNETAGEVEVETPAESEAATAAPDGVADGASGAVMGASEPAAPASDSWRPPEREEYERAQEELRYLRDFRTNADRAREAIRAPKAKDADTDPDVAEAEALLAKYGNPGTGYNEWASALKNDPTLAFRTMRASGTAATAPARAALKALQNEFKEYRDQAEREFSQMRAFRRLAPHQFATAPKWEKHGEFVKQEVQSGRYNLGSDEAVEAAITHAYEVAELRALKADKTPAQAAAAGAKAAEKVAGKALPKPTPRSESGGGRPSAPVAVSSQVKLNTADPQYWKKMGRAGADQAERELANERRR